MTAVLINHLWQSTLFALGAGLLTLALRSNGARYRYGLWFAASVKFLLPFAMLAAAGRWAITQLHPRTPMPAPAGLLMARQMIEPISPDSTAITVPAAGAIGHAAFHLPVPAILLCLWALGSSAVLTLWALRWSRVHMALLASSPLTLATPTPARSSPSLLEPGVVGVFRPVLMFPKGIEAHLSAAELDAVLAHELCHLRRRDNLTAALHMLVEALFWFHPLVWWIGSRLIAEREQACDEGVIAAGADPRVYAEGILKVCRFYLQLPLVCAAGVSGSNLKRRVETIMSGSSGAPLGARKTLLVSTAAVLAVAAPLAAGVVAALPAEAQTVILEKAGIPASAPAQAPAAEPPSAPVPTAGRAFAQTLVQGAQTLAAPGEALAAAVSIEAPAAPGLRLAALTEPTSVSAAEPTAESPRGAAQSPPPASCRLATLATFQPDPRSYVPLIGGQINGRKLQFMAALSSPTAVFRSDAKPLDVLVPAGREDIVYTPGGAIRITGGWIHDLELDGMSRKALDHYDVHQDFRVQVRDADAPSRAAAVLGAQFWSLADDDFDLASDSISLVRPAGCASRDTLPFNGGAFSQTRLLVPPTSAIDYRVTVMVDGVPLEAEIDTGAGTTIMTRQGAYKLDHRWPLPSAEPAGSLSTTGPVKVLVAKARFKTFGIGEETISHPRIMVADLYNCSQEIKERWMHNDLPHPGVSCRPNIYIPDMILGADFFHAHHVLISNSRRMVYFVYNGAPIFQ